MEDTDCCLSKEIPSGLEESQKSGAAANMARRARNPEDTSPGSVNKLSTVPESTEGEEKEDLEESESGMAEMAKKMMALVKKQFFHLLRCHQKQQFPPVIR
jgi:hypothetical protein